MKTSISTVRPSQATSRETSGSSQLRKGRSGRWARVGGRAKAIWLLGLVQLIPTALVAQKLDVLYPARPDSFLTDYAGIVDRASAARINDLAGRLQAATGAELAVVTLPTIGDRAPVEVATAIGRAWGVGAKAAIGDERRNAGVVLLLVPRTPEHQGEVFLSPGRGIEGIITDATAGAMLDVMLPSLRAGDYGPALVTGTGLVVARTARGFGVTDSALLAAEPRPQSTGGTQLPVWAVILILTVLFVLLYLMSRPGGRGGRHGGWGRGPIIFWGGGGWGGGGGRWSSGGGGWGSGGGGFGFGGGGGFSGGGAGRSF